MPTFKAHVVLSDIEGTTTPIAFVKDVLFPFARERMQSFLETNTANPEIEAALQAVSVETGQRGLVALTATLQRWIDEDRKATPLKTLQGLIWQAGYESGALKSIIYPDAANALRRWHSAGMRIAIYSSGSVQAQKLLFGYSDHGSFLQVISGWFDTTSGNKRERAAYQRIASDLGALPNEILFLSDVTAELDAARDVGLQTCWLVRANDIQPSAEDLRASQHPIARTFAEIAISP